MSSMGAAPMLPQGKTIELTEGVYIIPGEGVPFVPNVGIIVGDEGVLVIDTGMGPANAEIVLAEVRKITDLPIHYLVCTHFHPEHCFGAQSFPEEVVIIYSTAQHRDLTGKGEFYLEWFAREMGDGVRKLLEPVKLVDPDITFERRAEINLGNLPVVLIHAGLAAHTGGDTVVYLPQQKVLFAGGLTPHQAFPIVPDEDSSIDGWIDSLGQLSDLEVDIIVPGHGATSDASLITFCKIYLETFRAKVVALKQQGLEMEAVQRELFQEYSARYPDWIEPFWINKGAERAYAEAACDNS